MDGDTHTHRTDGPGDRRIEYFDGLAETWDEQYSDRAAARRHLERLREVIGLRPGRDVLEVGCGSGSLTAWLVEAVRPGRVTAVDFAPRMIAIAAGRGIDASFRLLDVCSDALGECLYDVALCFHSFPHFRDQAAAVENIARSLKQGGRLAVVHIECSDAINAFHASLAGPVSGDRLPGGDEWNGLLARAGLELRELRDDGHGFLMVASKAAVSLA
ncbi:MAG: methyltransferase domain-containing protein [Planctomycetes bacterium]|nr:methyltransferase domain-containing protein [Planctomycetota bacterium]